MALWRDKKKGYWRFEFQKEGERITGSGYKTKSSARAGMERKKKEINRIKTGIGMAFSEVANLYLDYAERRFTKQTYDYKAYVYRSFLEHTKDLFIPEITPQILHQYLNTRPSNNNYNVHRREMCALFSFARRQLKIDMPHPCWDLEKMPYTTPKKDPLSEKDLLMLIVAAEPEMERPLILVLIHTLARVGEVLRLTWQDVNFEAKTVTLWTRKRKGGAYEGDTMFMNRDLYSVMRGLWKKRIQEKWVFYDQKAQDRFPRLPWLMPRLCQRAKVQGYGFHHIRHFVATYLADKEKISKKAISGLLRHKSLRTTEIYIGDAPESGRVAMETIEGRFKFDPKTECGSECGFGEKPHSEAQKGGMKSQYP